MTYDEILDYEYDFDDAGVSSLRGYFHSLLHKVWNEGEGFDGKRPFGNSGWEYDIYTALVAMGAVVGTLDEEGYLVDFDRSGANELVFNLISHITGY